LEATQDDDGLGYISIKKDGLDIFNADDLLPEGFKFVTPRYFEQHPDDKVSGDYHNSSWTIENQRKLILLGEFEVPQDILGLLHELGHAHQDTGDDDIKVQKLNDDRNKSRPYGRSRHKNVEANKGIARHESQIERRAWSWAIKKFRDINNGTEADLKSIFPDRESLIEYVHDNLASYRRGYEWIIKGGHDEKFFKELQTYFDKWSYE
jgi:hypothetical protein